ncbi:outer membrane protein assembly factor BamB family protein [Halorarum salinum]|uniref:PQQ-like beta-propeller repeat protein n=1 Tax=Halorarum salinum TaxID=2743089 RepID=A0A7D5L894_9EURY|nr:PQQ-binding-like beta-propeller repeat protein [Halobaculum salinum]QLG60473.1 PQQ-like beta-propeller repeat protein [Halobaculum salinum]
MEGRAETPVDGHQKPAVAVVDGTVYLAGGSVVTALDAADGGRRWSTRITPERDPGSGAGYTCSLAVADGRVFVGTHDGLFALGTDGEERWSRAVEAVDPGYSGVFRSPAVVGGTVYFCTAEERALLAYGLDGEERWRRPLDGVPLGGPAVGDGRVYVGDDEAGVHAISTDGSHLWTASVGDVRTTPAVADGTVYAAGRAEEDGGGGEDGDYLASLDGETGDRNWVTDRGPNVVGSPVVLDEDLLACVSWLGSVFTYRRDDGALNWGAPIGPSGPTMALPAADGRRVFVAGEDGVAAVAPWRERSWRVAVDGAEGGVALADGALFVGSGRGYCYALA